ncbi:MAG: TnpV protein [Clostridia bacterium]|nr:TnpV protein [Clostridia bacterium]
MNMTMKNNTNIQYRQVGDFNIPNLTIPTEEARVTLGKWGMLYKDYLLKHKKVLFTTLLAEGKLYQHCAKVENQARDMFDTLIDQMKENESITEKLKEENQLEWVCRMQNIEARAREIVEKEIVFN